MVNELAPRRAHNSGHHTIEQCATSQFGQLLRVVLDLPLGDVSPTRAKAAAMVNILGSPSVAKGSKPCIEAAGSPGQARRLPSFIWEEHGVSLSGRWGTLRWWATMGMG